MDRLSQYLQDEGLTQAEFARLVGVSQPTVSDWIQGRMRPSVDNLIVLSKITDLSLEELLSDKSVA